MAVVSISRIQIRRGKKNTGTGLPQLASGEFGWAVDTQELFIGNGSVAEGAPYVGNTKLLSENDDLFQFADSYTYKRDKAPFVQTGALESTPVQRTLQERLDDIVSIRSFGALGNGADQTGDIQRAIFELFLNTNKTSPQSRVTLYFEPGTYVVNDTIYLPPNTTIKGAGINKTIFKSSGSTPVFRTVNANHTPFSLPDTSDVSAVQPEYIECSDFTMEFNNTVDGIVVENCRRSKFENIEMRGGWGFGSAISNNNSGIKILSSGGDRITRNNIFKNITFFNLSYGVYSDVDQYDNVFDSMNFNTLGAGVVFGENMTLGSAPNTTLGSFGNKISNSLFRSIQKWGVYINFGVVNSTENNKFYTVGNDGGNDASAVYPIINFGEANNASIGDWFARTGGLAYNPQNLYNVPYIPEISGETFNDMVYPLKVGVVYAPDPLKLIRLPANNPKSFEIDYVYESNAYDITRSGTITVTVDPTNNFKSLADDYEFIGDNNLAENLQLYAELYDENGDNVLDTLSIMMLNYQAQDSGNFHYRVKTKL